jgi:hypothetical protein
VTINVKKSKRQIAKIWVLKNCDREDKNDHLATFSALQQQTTTTTTTITAAASTTTSSTTTTTGRVCVYSFNFWSV